MPKKVVVIIWLSDGKYARATPEEATAISRLTKGERWFTLSNGAILNVNRIVTMIPAKVDDYGD